MQEHEIEYKYLEDTFKKGGKQVTIVYGMNQVGKSFLFKNFALIHEGIFFSCMPGDAKEIRRNFARNFGIKESDEKEVIDYTSIFSQIFTDIEKKYVFILDNFHNMIRNDESFFPSLLSYMELNLKDCLVYLISSHIGWVENQMIAKLGKSANAITGFLKMKEMSFEESCQLFPSYSTYDVLTLYAVFGGQRGYLEMVNQEVPMIENICNILISPNSYVLARMHQYIEEQLRETSVYYTILSALAKENWKLNDIYKYTGFSRAKISVYLKTLMELEFVDKIFSIDTPGRMNLQKGVYRIINPIILFYFKFIYPNKTDLVIQNPYDFYEHYISNEIKSVVFDKFEDVCRNMFVSMNQENDLPFFCTAVGTWVGKTGTIPVVGKNEKEKYMIGFSCRENGSYSLHEYKKQFELTKEAKINPEYIYLFSLHGFHSELVDFANQSKSLILIDMS